MNKEYWFEMCWSAQKEYLKTHGIEEHKRWQILVDKIEDSGWTEEYQAWYKAQQDLAVAEWNTKQLKKQQEAKHEKRVN